MNFPNLQKKIGGLTLSPPSFKTLLPKHEVDDNIINAFFFLMATTAKKHNVNVLPFETFLVSNIIDRNYMTPSYQRWIDRSEMWNHEIWMLPVHHEIGSAFRHWTLLMIFPNSKMMIYFDSVHGQPLKEWIYRLCAFIETYNKGQQINWDEWNVFVPRDIPLQYSHDPNSQNNCGVHVCAWAYLLCTGQIRSFTEENMNTSRKNIANILINSNIPETIQGKKVELRNAIIFKVTTHH